MKFSEQWLRDWVNPQISADTLSAQLTMAGLEVESVKPVANSFTDVVVGMIIDAQQHPNADRLRVCTVDIGVAEKLQIVCGASNARAGLKAPVALVGAVLGKDFTIKKAKLRGVDSAGMLCSSSELGLAETSDGLLELSPDAPIGLNIRDYLQLNDTIIYLNITPNRGDCLSLQGIAREVAAINKLTLSMPAITSDHPAKTTAHSDVFPVMLHAVTECPRYVGRIIRNVNLTAQTPLWLKERLRRSDIRSINPVVDVTNYIMLELGQPMHAFDLDKLKQKIEVRMAKEGESIVLLDGQEARLTSKTLVIADSERPQAIAGVMGGVASGVTNATSHIFLESAFFAPLSIAYAAKQYGLKSESSHRFERGVDPQLQVIAIERATDLLLSIVGGSAGSIIEEVATDQLPPKETIHLRRQRIGRILGIQLTDIEIETCLQHLGMEIRCTEDGWQVNIPSYRSDLHIEIDLIEELARIYGYDHIPSRLPFAELQSPVSSEATVGLSALREGLINRGYREIITYSFVAPAVQKLLDPEHQPLPLLNPISQDMSVMRTNMWAGLVETALYNQRRQETRLRLFESGLCFLPQSAGLLQEPRLAGLIMGDIAPEQWGMQKRSVDFFDLKGDLEALLSLTHCAHEFSFQAQTHPALHPSKTAAIYRHAKKIGYIGALHPSLQQKLALEQAVYLFELRLEELQQGGLPQAKPLSKFPAVRRDLAMIIDDRVSFREIESKIMLTGSELLKTIQLFDVYRGKGIDSGKKSIALGLTFQHPSRTLVDTEINDLIQCVIAVLKQEFNAKLRE